jgi:PTH1 family peptidyl-tRNA hydrolase
MKLLIGLGNPGDAYARHRHNVGFMALDRIAARHRLPPWRKRFRGLFCEGSLGGHRVVLLKPQTFMNDSGRSAGEVLRFFKIAVGDVIAFHDELDLAAGKIRIKRGGGNAGHNGLRSLSAHIGNDYLRVRIGIGHPGAKELVERYVLSDFAKADQAWLEPLLDAIAEAAPTLAADNEARFQNDVARALAGVAKEPSQRGEGVEPAAPRAAGLDAPRSAAKPVSALAASLKKWLTGRADET